MDSQLENVLEVLNTLDTPEERREIIAELPKDLMKLLVLYYTKRTPKPNVRTHNSCEHEAGSDIRSTNPAQTAHATVEDMILASSNIKVSKADLAPVSGALRGIKLHPSWN